MEIPRPPGRLEIVTPLRAGLTRYSMSTAPHRPGAALLRPPPALITADRTPVVGRVAIHGGTLHFRAAPQHLTAWLRLIDRWIAYDNGVVEE